MLNFSLAKCLYYFFYILKFFEHCIFYHIFDYRSWLFRISKTFLSSITFFRKIDNKNVYKSAASQSETHCTYNWLIINSILSSFLFSSDTVGINDHNNKKKTNISFLKLNSLRISKDKCLQQLYACDCRRMPSTFYCPAPVAPTSRTLKWFR